MTTLGSENRGRSECVEEVARERDRFRRIVWSLVRNAKWVVQDHGGVPLWSNVSWLTGLGCSSAIELCEEFGVDPHERTKEYVCPNCGDVE